MQITRPLGDFVEKIVRDSNGRLVRATFCVYENNGHIKARLIKAIYLEEFEKIENKVATLPGSARENSFQTKTVFEEKVVSPYFDSNLLYSLGSKPRAPTF